jgi:tRNA pseudouridine55 synthase
MNKDGILLFDKCEGETSSDLVRKVKRFLKIKKVGHSGTLDPFATGLLIVLLGQGTKLSHYIMAGEKKYLAVMHLGLETDTMDSTGSVICSKPIVDLDPDKIEKTVHEFTGEIEQVPPMFSAVKVNGEPAYKLARKGLKVALKKRTVIVYSLEIISIDLPKVTLNIRCSGGTYVRSLASDIGKRLNSCACLSSLRRTGSGPFDVMNAIKSEEIGDSSKNDRIFDNVISLRDALVDVREININKTMAEKIRNGFKPDWSYFSEISELEDSYKGFLKLVYGSELVAVMDVNRLEDNWIMKIRNFN